MAEDDETASIFPIRIEETIAAIARLHAEHRASATTHHRLVERVTSFLTHRDFLVILTALVVGWMAGNVGAPYWGYPPIDPPPFPGLACAATLASLYFVTLILTAQKRDDDLSRRRQLLTLELAIFAEQKNGKIIALLEELRRDSPAIHDRVDEQADVMSRPADPKTVFEAINETRSETGRASRGPDNPPSPGRAGVE